MLNVREYLGSHAVFGRLEPETLDRMAERFRPVVIPAHRSLYREGEEPPALHLVVGGWVKLVRTSPEGHELVMALAGPGDLFGPCCQPVESEAAPCSAHTQAVTKLLVMGVQAWRATVTSDPLAAKVAISALMSTHRRCTDLPQRLAFRDVESRLAGLLLELSQWSVNGNDGRELPRILSQGEMASAIGTAREVVTRALGRFEDRGLIGRRGRRILVRDEVGLRELQG